MRGGTSRSPSGTLAVIAALPRELAGLSRALGAKPIHHANGVHVAGASWTQNGPTVLLVTAGMGGQRVTLAVAAAIAQGAVRTLLSVGLAGACDARFKAGSALEASLVVDSLTG